MKPHFKKERELLGLGFDFICGLDEAGRGALAGPLVAGAVILNPKTKRLFNDSKLLSRKKREDLFEILKKISIAWSTGIVSVEEINNFGIQTANYLAFERAIQNLSIKPSFLLIDYYRLPGTNIPQSSITKGDRVSQSIAAASIVAKVERDRMMTELENETLGYRFDKHMGYSTKLHQKMIIELGASELHRTKFIDKKGQNQLHFI